jgi:hypothetical protein
MKNNILFLSFILIIFCSCSKLNLFEKEGKYDEKRYELAAITKIKNHNTFHIEIVQDEEEYLLLKGGENVLKVVTVSFSDQEIILDHQYKNWTRNYDLITAEIHIKNLQTITIDSPAKISNSGTLDGVNLNIDITAEAELVEMNLNLNYASMQFHTHGSVSGGYEFAGICPLANYVLNGITNIKSSNLQSQTISLAQNGIGEAHVWAEEKLNVTIYNIGDMYYKGNPIVNINRIQVNNQSPTAKVLPE